MSKPQFVYVTYIQTTPEKLWRALTDSNMTQEYWAHKNVSDWKTGSRWEHQRLDGSGSDMTGKVLESKPFERLVLSWVSPEHEGNPAKTSRVGFELKPIDNQVCLTVIHEELEPESEMLKGITWGWPVVLSSLKTYLETGSALSKWWADCKS